VSGKKPEIQCSPFETAAFDTLRERLDGVDLTRAIYLGRGIQVTAYRAGDWVIRVPRTAAARKKVAQQTRVSQILAARGLAVPRDAQIAQDADGEVIAGLYRYVPGVPATAARRSPVLARDLGAFLTALHAVPLEPVRSCSTVLGDLWTDRFRIRWERARSHLPAAEREWLEEVITRFLASPETTSPRLVLIHGDLGRNTSSSAPTAASLASSTPAGPGSPTLPSTSAPWPSASAGSSPMPC
jgi:aminoglycoside phosphotransferase (APT) family kinase protein